MLLSRQGRWLGYASPWSDSGQLSCNDVTRCYLYLLVWPTSADVCNCPFLLLRSHLQLTVGAQYLHSASSNMQSQHHHKAVAYLRPGFGIVRGQLK